MDYSGDPQKEGGRKGDRRSRHAETEPDESVSRHATARTFLTEFLQADRNETQHTDRKGK